mmetsp:Transcript_98138/g.194324  ORF Transcript_98138/g.194324 Transcript_98138/m.194324 type:complete len:331 (+) Transcript_98138:1982-2974(+)
MSPSSASSARQRNASEACRATPATGSETRGEPSLLVDLAQLRLNGAFAEAAAVTLVLLTVVLAPVEAYAALSTQGTVEIAASSAAASRWLLAVEAGSSSGDGHAASACACCPTEDAPLLAADVQEPPSFGGEAGTCRAERHGEGAPRGPVRCTRSTGTELLPCDVPAWLVEVDFSLLLSSSLAAIAPEETCNAGVLRDGCSLGTEVAEACCSFSRLGSSGCVTGWVCSICACCWSACHCHSGASALREANALQLSDLQRPSRLACRCCNGWPPLGQYDSKSPRRGGVLSKLSSGRSKALAIHRSKSLPCSRCCSTAALATPSQAAFTPST